MWMMTDGTAAAQLPACQLSNITSTRTAGKGESNRLGTHTHALLSIDPTLLYYHSKPSGTRAGRKLRVHRRNEKWASKVSSW